MKKILLIFFVILFSCSANKNDTEKKIFRYNESAGLLSLDPIYAKDQPHIWACGQLFNGLVAFDDDMNIVPSIASHWTVSDDGLQYDFILRDDVYFHHDTCFPNSTRKVGAHDVEYSFNRLLDPSLNSSGTWIFSNVASYSALSDSLFHIQLKTPFPAFLGVLAMPYAFIVPQEAVDFYGSNFGRHPIGTGPFTFTNWQEGVKLVLTKNPNYFEVNSLGQKLPLIDGVAVSFIIDRQVAFLEFIKGKFDCMSGIDARYKDELLSHDGELREAYHNKINLLRTPYLNTEYMSFNLKYDLGLNDSQYLALRQAISYAIDREKMLRYLRNGIGKPGNGGFIPYGLQGSDTTIGYPFNLNKAADLVRTYHLAGTQITLYATSEYLDLAKFVQSAVNEIGIVCEVEEMMSATLREKRATGDLPFFRASWVADYSDAENYLALFTSQNFTPKGPNYSFYSNKKYDELYNKSLTIRDFDERVAVYHQMDSLMMTEAPVVVLFYDEVLRFVNKRVENMRCNPTNYLNLKEIDINLSTKK